MEPLFLTMRVLHVVLGIFWAGTIVFAALMMMPSIRDAGPDGGKVLLALMRRGYGIVIPVVALVTLVSGFWLYMNMMSSIGPVWAGSMSARIYGVGAIAAVIAFCLGMFIVRPSANKLVAAMEAMPAATDGPARAALAERMAAPRARMAAASPWIAGLLIVAALCMSLARYL